MKFSICFIVILFFYTSQLVSDNIYSNNGYFGNFQNGRLYGKSGILFDISNDGRIYGPSGYLGQINKQGYVYGRNGYLGQVEESGRVYDPKGFAGSIDRDGRIYGRNGYLGQGANVPRNVLAIVFFFLELL
jgi:hypothetical protein